MHFRPLHNRVLIKRSAPADKTESGLLFIPESSQERKLDGEVKAVGKGRIVKNTEHAPVDVQVGERVMFGPWSGTDIKIEGEEQLILNDDDIIGVLADGAADGVPTRVLSDRFLILPDKVPDERTSRGGIIIPRSARDNSHMCTGRVVKIGPGMPCADGTRWPMPMDVKEGDRILYKDMGARIVTINKVKYASVHEELVLAVLADDVDVATMG
jgi:chaperonin GroES